MIFFEWYDRFSQITQTKFDILMDLKNHKLLFKLVNIF